MLAWNNNKFVNELNNKEVKQIYFRIKNDIENLVK
jgi:hypothetical protein